MANNYIDNQKFLVELEAYKKHIKEAKKAGLPKPPIPEYIGKCFYDIATHLSLRPEFVNYSYRDEMVSDGIENCCNYLENFNPNAISKNKRGNNFGKKTKGPFPYFSQMIYWAFIRRILKERKQKYIQYMSLQQYSIMASLYPEDYEHLADESSSKSLTQTQLYANMNEFIDEFEKKKAAKDRMKKAIKKKNVNNNNTRNNHTGTNTKSNRKN